MKNFTHIHEQLKEKFDFKKNIYSNLFDTDKYFVFFGDSNISLEEINKLLQLIFSEEHNIYIYYDNHIQSYNSEIFLKKSILSSFLENYTDNSMYPFIIFSDNINKFMYMDTIFEDIFLIGVNSSILKIKIEEFNKKNEFTWISEIQNKTLQQRFLLGEYLTNKQLNKLTKIYSNLYK
ncbi:hypothetical protein ACQUD9_13530 [Vagococcus fluvialis]|uniref:hypothetical protein n=1 Tax=Vagococcus fluvialis TaxID=2738 RepID=UPI003D0BAF5F